jgi:hypothetical protein
VPRSLFHGSSLEETRARFLIKGGFVTVTGFGRYDPQVGITAGEGLVAVSRHVKQVGRRGGHVSPNHQISTASTLTAAGTSFTTFVCSTICMFFFSHPAGRVFSSAPNRPGSLRKSAAAWLL